MGSENPRECVLLVDDDPATLELLALHVAEAGYEPLRARSGLQALVELQERRPRLVVADWVMPGMDGLTLCREVRSQPDGALIHFIMLTMRSDKDRLLEAFEAGVDDFLAKPFHEGELLARIRAGMRMVQVHERMNQSALAVARANAELSTVNLRLHELATTDDLTGLANRRQAMTRLRELWAFSKRYEQPLSCAIIDVDRFKQLNDRHGHLKGDEVLQKIATMLSRSVRSADIVCRLGGDEFLVLFPMQGAGEIGTCCERCRSAVASHVFLAGAAAEPVTVSVGAAQRTAEMSGPDDLIKAADDSLYAAKAQQRNVVVIGAASYA
jgi:two-component system, cell cycle response regulator